MSSEEKISTDANNSSSSKEKKDDENSKMNARGEPEEDPGEDQLVIDEPEEKSDGESDEKEFEPTIGIVHHMFSRILNLKNYEKKIIKYSLFQNRQKNGDVSVYLNKSQFAVLY